MNIYNNVSLKNLNTQSQTFMTIDSVGCQSRHDCFLAPTNQNTINIEDDHELDPRNISKNLTINANMINSSKRSRSINASNIIADRSDCGRNNTLDVLNNNEILAE